MIMNDNGNDNSMYCFMVRSSLSHSLYRPVYHTVVTWISWISTASATEKGALRFMLHTTLSHVEFGLPKKSKKASKNVISRSIVIVLLLLEPKPLYIIVPIGKLPFIVMSKQGDRKKKS